MLRASSEAAFPGFFFEEVFAVEVVVDEFQESEDGCATGLVVLGGMKAGGAPRSSA